MRRVLFYYDNYCGASSRGGTEVATYRIAKALSDSGEVEVFNAYRRNGGSDDKAVYKDTIKLSGSPRRFNKELKAFIQKHDIGYVVNMGRFFRHKSLVKGVRQGGKEVKVFFMQHFAPGSEMKKATFSSGWHLFKLNPYNPIYWLRITLYPLLKLRRNYLLPKIYKKTYCDSDGVILLSEGYKDEYCNTGKFRDTSKFVVIPNIYEPEFKEGFSDKILEGKEKRVLILSRMDEIQKRMSLALMIWEKIEEDPDLYDWRLDIVGTGHNKDIVKRLIKKLGLERVTFHGWCPRGEFLKNSSILMLTSEYEGQPLSVLEAQSHGCVTIAYNSFASLKDVVQPFTTGVIVEKFGDVKTYVEKITELMYDPEYRKELGRNSLEASKKYSPEKIAKEWLKILT